MTHPSDSLLRDLYVNQGLSVAQAAKRLGCSQNRVNYWLRKYRIPKRTISDALYRRHNPDGNPFSISKIITVPQAILAGIGLGLYWGEGNKKNRNSIRLGNTDPLLIRKFVRFLRSSLGVPASKLRFGLQIFSDMKPATAVSFWVDILRGEGITKRQFQKPVVTPARSLGTYREKTKHGVLTVYCSNVKLKRILDDLLAKNAV